MSIEPERTPPPIPQAADVEVRRWEFNGAPDDVGSARRMLSDILRDHEWGDADIDAAALLLSELATNAVRHAQCPFAVTAWVDGVVSVAVSDSDGAGEPVIRKKATSDGGLGLQIVSSMSTRWGLDRHGAGKSVWFELDPNASG